MRKLSLVLALLYCASAMAQAIYKQVDKDGKVTYTDKAPDKDQPATKVDIDKNRNVATPLGTRSPAAAKGVADANLKAREMSEARFARELEKAEARLSKAKEDLANGKDPQEDDWSTVGVASGRAGRMLNEAYQERVKRLEDAVKQAEGDVARAQANYRRNAASN
jgi:Domain of unknown function (DUF4124)